MSWPFGGPSDYVSDVNQSQLELAGGHGLDSETGESMNFSVGEGLYLRVKPRGFMGGVNGRFALPAG